MTQEEAIKILEDDFISNEVEEKEYNEAIKYAINQLKQCEVFDEPVEMEVKDSIMNSWQNERVVGKFKGFYLIETPTNQNDYFALFENAKPIKPKPLSFTDWVKGKELVENTCEPIKGWRDKFLNEKIIQYTEYLKQFNEK